MRKSLASLVISSWFGDYRSLRFCAVTSVAALFILKGGSTMEKIYEQPTADVIIFAMADIITTSGSDDNSVGWDTTED